MFSQEHSNLLQSLTGDEPCTKGNPEQWVEGYTSSDLLSKETAEAMCAGCPVLELCRDYAVKAGEQYGVWGGTRPVDRGFNPPSTKKLKLRRNV